MSGEASCEYLTVEYKLRLCSGLSIAFADRSGPSYFDREERKYRDRLAPCARAIHAAFAAWKEREGIVVRPLSEARSYQDYTRVAGRDRDTSTERIELDLFAARPIPRDACERLGQALFAIVCADTDSLVEVPPITFEAESYTFHFRARPSLVLREHAHLIGANFERDARRAREAIEARLPAVLSSAGVERLASARDPRATYYCFEVGLGEAWGNVSGTAQDTVRFQNLLLAELRAPFTGR